jgi:hypothetical protein
MCAVSHLQDWSVAEHLEGRSFPLGGGPGHFSDLPSYHESMPQQSGPVHAGPWAYGQRQIPTSTADNSTAPSAVFENWGLISTESLDYDRVDFPDPNVPSTQQEGIQKTCPLGHGSHGGREMASAPHGDLGLPGREALAGPAMQDQWGCECNRHDANPSCQPPHDIGAPNPRANAKWQPR